SFDECLKIYSDINILNTPSYLGGDLIAKAGGDKVKDWKWAKKMAKRHGGTPAQHYASHLVQKYRPAGSDPAPTGPGIAPSAQAALRELDFATAVHASAVRGGHGVDVHVTKAQLDRATTQCQLEIVKAAQARPIAYSDLGVINMMRQGRP